MASVRPAICSASFMIWRHRPQGVTMACPDMAPSAPMAPPTTAPDRKSTRLSDLLLSNPLIRQYGHVCSALSRGDAQIGGNEGMGQEFGDAMFDQRVSFRRRAVNGERPPGHLLGFVHDLAAPAAGGDDGLPRYGAVRTHGAAHDRNRLHIGKAAMRIRRGQRHSFGA